MRHLNFSNAAAALALFVALGGTAWALASNSVKSKHIATNAVKSAEIKDGAVKGAEIKDGAVKSADLRDGGVKARDIGDGQVGRSELAANAITADKLACEGNDSGDHMVRAGSACIDRYEASVWSQPDGGVQYGISSDDYPCDDNGQGCTSIYARSVAGVTPSRHITWFQAQRALANSGKRLLTNVEWQLAASGTPDGAPCNVSSAGPVSTGAASTCVSEYGAYDMVGNVWEWVADWIPASTTCASWPPGYGDDLQCLAGAGTSGPPEALLRGGHSNNGTGAGPFAINGHEPSGSVASIGFRGAR